ncbi:hypothetical protein BAE44_0017935 [Dichanthelium oligosanthes]|uniref:Uncharacterized protein n=1 Tax=Dichanthelium oligosanthes TaxID=888268 RepID=A0A1E5V7A6_9POAL|nr:hypothetical protein BAE44_0017935 [Dichanthelium oligosanthes]
MPFFFFGQKKLDMQIEQHSSSTSTKSASSEYARSKTAANESIHKIGTGPADDADKIHIILQMGVLVKRGQDGPEGKRSSKSYI